MKRFLFALLFFSYLNAEEEVAFFDDSLPYECEEMSCEPPTAREERCLFEQICQESHRLYNSLDCRGKVRAIELSKECEDKDCAVQMAAREMSERQMRAYREEKTFSQQLEKKAGQTPYQRRFGN